MNRTAAFLCLALLLAGGCRSGGGAAAVGEKRTPTAARPMAPEGKTEQAAALPRGTLPIPDLGYNSREGRALYRHYCVTCHGEEGHGDGFNAYNLDPKPRDLADPAFQSKRSDDDLVALIRSGGGIAGLSTGMPPWGRVLGERKIRNIVDYLRTLPNTVR